MLLSDIEVAQLLSVSRTTVWRWLKDIEGFPEPLKIGGATRWRRADVAKFVSSLATIDRQDDVEDYIKRVAE
jgi:predicted DNA-binding transcriptional regulator AlpA